MPLPHKHPRLRFNPTNPQVIDAPPPSIVGAPQGLPSVAGDTALFALFRQDQVWVRPLLARPAAGRGCKFRSAGFAASSHAHPRTPPV